MPYRPDHEPEDAFREADDVDPDREGPEDDWLESDDDPWEEAPIPESGRFPPWLIALAAALALLGFLLVYAI